MIIVTGGLGFIGSNFIDAWLEKKNEKIINIDKCTYAANIDNTRYSSNINKYEFLKGDICDAEFIENLLKKYHPRAVINFAAESHVDRSILGPKEFINTNINGVFNLLQSINLYLNNKKIDKDFKFIQISTDEVYGSLLREDSSFIETSRYAPNSPYAASKASADMLARAWHKTFNLPVIITNCSNNYGPYQFPEKFIPLIIFNALNNISIPIYGNGLQIRDWLYVKDHCLAIMRILDHGKIGETYNIGGKCEITNLDLVNKICEILDKKIPCKHHASYKNLISFVKDRPGHDIRYSINSSKIENDIKWKPIETFETGLDKTVNWYLDNIEWLQSASTPEYKKWVKRNYK